MTTLGYLLAAFFLPLFPLSMLFNYLFMRVRNVWVRMLLVLLWPQAGVLLVNAVADSPPRWLVYWGGLTAILYAFRALALKDLGLWAAYMATSSWALLWASAGVAGSIGVLGFHAIGLSLAFALLVWLIARLETHFGAAYASPSWGLALSVPRLSAMVVLTIVAAVATPLFPAFFVLLDVVIQALPILPGFVVMVLATWLLWAWSGSRMVQGLIVGPAYIDHKTDLGGIHLGLLVLVFLLAILVGILTAGGPL